MPLFERKPGYSKHKPFRIEDFETEIRAHPGFHKAQETRKELLGDLAAPFAMRETVNEVMQNAASVLAERRILRKVAYFERFIDANNNRLGIYKIKGKRLWRR